MQGSSYILWLSSTNARMSLRSQPGQIAAWTVGQEDEAKKRSVAFPASGESHSVASSTSNQTKNEVFHPAMTSQSVSVIGPLPTAFSAASSCLAPQSIYDGFGYIIQGAENVNTDCQPDDFLPTSTAYYAGTGCPGGYTRACGGAMDGGISVATCCPRY
jgi:hypothetical protein